MNFGAKTAIDAEVKVLYQENEKDSMMTLFDDEQILKAYAKDIDDNAAPGEAGETAGRLLPSSITITSGMKAISGYMIVIFTTVMSANVIQIFCNYIWICFAGFLDAVEGHLDKLYL